MLECGRERFHCSRRPCPRLYQWPCDNAVCPTNKKSYLQDWRRMFKPSSGTLKRCFWKWRITAWIWGVSGTVGKTSRLLHYLSNGRLDSTFKTHAIRSALLPARSIYPTERKKQQMNVRIIVIVEESSTIECGCRLYRWWSRPIENFQNCP